MRVICKQPGSMPEIIEVDNTLEALQEKVGGYIETLSLFTDVSVICNEEGRIKGMAHNVNVLGVDFCGPILLVGVSGEDFTDLSDDALECMMKYLKRMEGIKWEH